MSNADCLSVQCRLPFPDGLWSEHINPTVCKWWYFNMSNLPCSLRQLTHLYIIPLTTSWHLVSRIHSALKGQERLGRVEGLNIFYSMKCSKQSAKLNMASPARAGPDSSKRQRCAWQALVPENQLIQGR